MLMFMCEYLRRIFSVSSSVLNEFIRTSGTLAPYVLLRCCGNTRRSMQKPRNQCSAQEINIRRYSVDAKVNKDSIPIITRLLHRLPIKTIHQTQNISSFDEKQQYNRKKTFEWLLRSVERWGQERWVRFWLRWATWDPCIPSTYQVLHSASVRPACWACLVWHPLRVHLVKSCTQWPETTHATLTTRQLNDLEQCWAKFSSLRSTTCTSLCLTKILTFVTRCVYS